MRLAMKTIAYASHSPGSPLVPYSFERRDLRDNDVAMEILHCGVCHSDMHMSRNDWGMTVYPVVPGHEIIGRVTDVGENESALAGKVFGEVLKKRSKINS